MLCYTQAITQALHFFVMEGGTHEKAHYPLYYAHLDIYLGDFRFGRKPACAAPGGEHPNRRYGADGRGADENRATHHPAEKLKTGFSAAYITEHYNICEISHATGETALGEKLNIVSYRLQPKDTQNEALLLIDEVQDASSGETLYFTLHYGDFDTGEVTRAEVVYP